MKLVITLVLSLLSVAQQDSEYRILIHKNDFSLLLYQGNDLVRQYGVCVGKNAGNKERKNDMKTPEGEFVVSQIQNSGRWVHDFKDGKGPIEGAYGPWFIRLKATSGPDWKGIGIHGTHDTTSIGTRASEGCVRLRNRELEELKRHVKIGTPVQILP